jgi:hypothetical protein
VSSPVVECSLDFVELVQVRFGVEQVFTGVRFAALEALGLVDGWPASSR